MMASVKALISFRNLSEFEVASGRSHGVGYIRGTKNIFNVRIYKQVNPGFEQILNQPRDIKPALPLCNNYKYKNSSLFGNITFKPVISIFLTL